MIRFIPIIIIFISAVCFAGAVPVNPDSLDEALSVDTSDSAMFIRAQLAYSRGLYQTAKELIERKKTHTRADLLMMGQCSHILAQALSARSFFLKANELNTDDLALLGLGELYCGDFPEKDSCAQYIKIIEKMSYLKRFVSLKIPEKNHDERPPISENNFLPDAWTLQFGAFSMKSLAEKLSEKIKKEGIESWIFEQNNNGNITYFVYGGRFATKGEAAAQADALAKEYTCKVVEYRR